MKIAINNIVLALGFILISNFVFGQVKESDRLKKQQKELENKINFTENLLENTTSTKVNLTQKISLINHKIQYRESLLNNINIQLKELNSDLITYSQDIQLMNERLVLLENQYKEMIFKAYKMRSETASIFFIISSANYNQASKRMAYMSQITKYRADQIKRINSLKVGIQIKQESLISIKADQVNLLANKQKEKKRYLKDREKKRTSIQGLEGKEKVLKDELSAQKKKANNIKRAINKAINKEIAEAQRLAKLKPKTIKETKEIQLNNAGFESNKGRLPWPVSKGEITNGYGKQPHPLHPGVYTYNNGLDITTVKGASVRAVYNGEVSSVINIPGAGKAIIIAHGNYRTIYSNLQEVYIQKGDKITTKQEIGALLLQSNGTMSEVHFEIRKITSDGQISNLNPSFWIYQ